MPAKPSERAFGVLPEWAKTGPITAANYSYRAEAHCAQKSAERQGLHPTVSLQSPDLKLWHEYFTVYLGRAPRAFALLLEATMREMTVPEQIPQWFDPSFEPHADYQIKGAA